MKTKMKVFNVENGLPIFSWCPGIDEEDSDQDTAFDQMSLIATLPFVRHCALMPDAHSGYSMPIGGVVACDGVVVPNFVGVDIGCGMGAIRTSLFKEDLVKAKCEELLHSFSRGIPVGFAHNDRKRVEALKSKYGAKYEYIYEEKTKASKCKTLPIDSDPTDAFFEQLGTLGGGNHFIEVQYDQNDNVWIMVHSGS